MKSISRHLKKLLALAFVCCLLITAVGPISALAEDISGHWAADEINFLREEGIVHGDSDGNINPNNSINRAEFVAIINRAFEFTEKGASNFPDVQSDTWYYDDFSIAKNVGYILGDENGNANPGKPIIRAEVAVIFGRVLYLEAKSATSAFLDSASFPDWSADSIIALTENGLINGYQDNTFRASNNMTRAEAFAILARVIEQGLISESEEVGDDQTPQTAPDSGTGNKNPSGSPSTDPKVPAAPTDLSIALTPGGALCSTLITFSGDKATEVDIGKYEFLIAPSVGANAVWTTLVSSDLPSKEVVVTSVRHYIFLRLKASGNTPASEPTTGVQLTAENVNLNLSGNLNPYVDYDAETITIPDWYEYGIYDWRARIAGLSGSVFNEPVLLPVGSYIYHRARITEDLPFVQYASRYWSSTATMSRMNPPPVDAVLLTPGTAEGTTNIKKSETYSHELEVKAVVPHADAKAIGTDAICDWTKLDSPDGKDIEVYEGCKIYIRATAVPNTDEIDDWGYYILGKYKSLPVTVRIVDMMPALPSAPTPEELSVTLAPGDYASVTNVLITGTKANIEDIEYYELGFGASPDETFNWFSLSPGDLNPQGMPFWVSSIYHNIYIRQKASGIVPAGVPTEGVQVTKDNVNLTLSLDFQWWINYDMETISVPDWYLYGTSWDFVDDVPIYDGVTGQSVPILPGTDVYVRNRWTDALPFEDIFLFFQIPERPAPPDALAGTLSPGSFPGTVNIKLSPLLEFKVVKPSADADATGSDVVMDWTYGDDEIGGDVLAMAGCKVFYRVAAAYPRWHWDDDLDDSVLEFGTFKSMPSLTPHVIQTADVNPGSGDAPDFTQAIACVSDLGIMDNDNGDFRPMDIMSRAEFAKALFVIATHGNSDASAFVDVEGIPYQDYSITDWFAGYVNWTYMQGIMQGASATTFDPNSPINGYEALRALLSFAGYIDYIEGYNESNWQMNVLMDALQAGLLTNLHNCYMGDGLNREQTARMIYNALFAYCVEYSDYVRVETGVTVGQRYFGL